MKRRKLLLLHAIQPGSHEPRQNDWAMFLRHATLLQLPAEAEQLAPNVWLLPDDGKAYLLLSRLGHQHAIETRTLPFSSAYDWKPLSPRP
jgi:hypothetical protein